MTTYGVYKAYVLFIFINYGVINYPFDPNDPSLSAQSRGGNYETLDFKAGITQSILDPILTHRGLNHMICIHVIRNLKK